MVGTGGVISNTGGKRQKDYAWGIGKNSNNYAEWLALFKGLEMANTLGIKELVVFGDSILVIREARKLVRKYKIPSTNMHHIFNSLVSEFNSINFIHILRTNNQFADQMANKGVELDFGFIICNGNNLERCWVL